MLLKSAQYLVTQDDGRRVLQGADVRIDGAHIAEVGPGLAAREGETVIDCSRRIVMPGLINAHCHLGMTGLRGVADDQQLHAWLSEIFARERAFTDADILAGSRLGLRESLRTGTTTVLDMYYRVRLCAQAAQEAGVRLVAAETFLEGHPLSAREISIPDDAACVRFIFGPHAPYSVDEALLRRIRKEASARSSMIHIHVAETRAERAECLRKHGALPIEYLDRIGFLGPDVMIAHANWLTKRELDIIAARGVKVVHCPQSNMKLAGGSAMPLREMHERGITVCLGTDSAASNNSLDMFREMHACALLHKHHYWDSTAAGAQQVLDMATVNAAAALGIAAGSIAPGRLADIVTLDLDDPNLQPIDAARVVSHLVYAANGLNVSESIINGVLLLHAKQFVR